MDKYFGATFMSLLVIAITAVGIYLAVILFTRIAGKRSFSKMSSFDFAMTITIGSIIGTTVLSASTSLIQGLVALAVVYTLQISVAILRRYSVVRNAIDNSPLLLMDGEKVLEENLRKARVSHSDLRGKLREANVIRLSQVKAVVFETTGDISVLHSDKEEITIEDWLLKGVKHKAS